jgi:diguanylate cyclase (GGDEF)-like protein
MDGSLADNVLGLDRQVLDRFMPMHLVLTRSGVVESIGPTLAGVVPELRPGCRFEEVFDVRSPGGAVTIADVLVRAGSRFRLVPKAGPRIGLRGVAMALPGGGRVLVNLSFGIDLIKAVREFGLTDADFAPTDLAMELLYLAEANAAVTGELKGLNLRLNGARLAAEEEAMTDGLTGLKNRRAADLYLARLCAAGTPFGLLHIDLDFFKAVNDTLGHAAGDHVLGMVGAVLREQTRTEDCAARVGGDEFVVILPERTDPRLLQAIAERIIAGVSVAQEIDGKVCRISASIGIVRSADHPRPDPAMILADSDAALYAAKRAGRSRAVLSGPLG